MINENDYLDEIEKLRVKYRFNFKKVMNMRNQIYNIKESLELEDAISDFYNFIKVILPSYYIDGRLSLTAFLSIKDEILRMESSLPHSNILGIKPVFLYDKEHEVDYEILHYSSADEIIKEIIYLTRFDIVDMWDYSLTSDLSNVCLMNKCFEISKRICHHAKKFGVDVEIIKIDAGFSNTEQIFSGSGYHYFNIITIEDKKYIIDCSYEQFFNHRQNNLDRLGIVELSGCLPGIYMSLTEDRKRVAKKILEDGYIELTDENFKHYCDGFALYYRNALYYERLGEVNYSTNYTIDDYYSFLYSDDSQLKREGSEVVGRQKRLLQNNDLIFNVKR